MNRSVIVGRLTRDPELRYTQGGTAVTSFTVAVNRPFKNQDGDYEADFINCVAWRKQAENVANFLKKGSQCGVDGRIQTRSYENNEGKKVFVTEIVADNVQFLEPKRESQPDGQQTAQKLYGDKDKDPFADDGKPIDISDDDLPF